jgi:hypothetical protein
VYLTWHFLTDDKMFETHKTHGRDKKYFYFGYKTSQEVTGITGFYTNRK